MSAATRAIELALELPFAPAEVWRCLSDEREYSRWYPPEAVIEPDVGGVIEAEWPGGFITAEPIVGWEPERLLATRWEDPHDPSQGLDLTWQLEPIATGTRLRLTHSGFPVGAEGDGFYDGCERGWRHQLASLEHYLRRHRGRDREVLFLSRPTLLAREAAWQALAARFGFGAITPASSELDFELPGARPFTGHRLWLDPPRDLVAIWREEEDALVRFQVDLPVGPGTPHVAYLFCSRWGGAPGALAVIEAEWERALEEALPR